MSAIVRLYRRLVSSLTSRVLTSVQVAMKAAMRGHPEALLVRVKELCRNAHITNYDRVPLHAPVTLQDHPFLAT